jgi:histone H3/H4
MKAYHSVSTALLKSVAEIGTQCAMKRSRKTLHECTSHIPH